MSEASFVIAEAGVNHNGSLIRALDMVRVAKSAGADAIKFQTFDASLLATAEARKADYQINEMGSNQSQQEMLRELELSEDEFVELSMFCREIGIEFLSTPFDEGSAEFLNSLGMTRFKIPSGEATNPRLIKKIASFNKPIILSTGMCSLTEVGRAIEWIYEVDERARLWILQCTTAYPVEYGDVNLRAMSTLRDAFNVPVGLSDHSLGTAIPLAAVAMGAIAIEKHFTLDRNLPGPDHRASLLPEDLSQMITGIRQVEQALGSGVKTPTHNELEIAKAARRSIVAASNLAAGTVISEDDIVFKRPGTGIEPADFGKLVGRRLRVDVQRDELLDWSMVA